MECYVCKTPLTPDDDKNPSVEHLSYPDKNVLGVAHEKCTEKEVKRELRFIDSFKFMAAGLGKLVDNLDGFSETSKFYQNERLKLLLRKGVYPYDYVNSLEKLEETNLPSKEELFQAQRSGHFGRRLQSCSQCMEHIQRENYTRISRSIPQV